MPGLVFTKKKCGGLITFIANTLTTFIENSPEEGDVVEEGDDVEEGDVGEEGDVVEEKETVYVETRDPFANAYREKYNSAKNLFEAASPSPGELNKADEIVLEILNLIGDVIKVYDKFCKNLDLDASDTLNLFKPDSTDLETISKQQEKLTLIKTVALINVLIRNIFETRLKFINTIDFTKYKLDNAKINVFINYVNDGIGFLSFVPHMDGIGKGLFKLFEDLVVSYVNENIDFLFVEAKIFETNKTVKNLSTIEINQVLTKYQLRINPIIDDGDGD